MIRPPVSEVIRHPQSRAMHTVLARLCRGRRLNVGLVEPMLSPQCHLRIGNDPPSLGRERVLRDLAQFVRRTEGLGLGYFDVWRCSNTLIVEMDCMMTCPAGRRVTVPCAAILRLSGQQIDDIRVYIERGGLPAINV